MVDGAGCGAAGDHDRAQLLDLLQVYLRPVERRRILDGLVSEDCDRAVEYPAHAPAPGRVEAFEISGGRILLGAARDRLVCSFHFGNSRSSLPWRSTSSATVSPRAVIVRRCRVRKPSGWCIASSIPLFSRKHQTNPTYPASLARRSTHPAFGSQAGPGLRSAPPPATVRGPTPVGSRVTALLSSPNRGVQRPVNGARGGDLRPSADAQ